MLLCLPSENFAQFFIPETVGRNIRVSKTLHNDIANDNNIRGGSRYLPQNEYMKVHNITFQHPVAMYRSDLGASRLSKNTQGSHNGQTKQNQKQPHATHITKITTGNYNRRKENRIIVSRRILNHNNLYL
jgi:hypothetical protein